MKICNYQARFSVITKSQKLLKNILRKPRLGEGGKYILYDKQICKVYTNSDRYDGFNGFESVLPYIVVEEDE